MFILPVAVFVDLVEHEDHIVQDEPGKAKFVPDTKFKK